MLLSTVRSSASPMSNLKKLVIQDYSPGWPQVYLREKAVVERAMGEKLLAIEHVGSTAVPGLGAKPIVDILAAVSRLADVETCVDNLLAVGFTFRPEAIEDMPDDRYFEKWVEGIEIAHLHVTEFRGPFWNRSVLFRDFLRTHPEAARNYEALKRELAPQFTRGYAYAEAKTSSNRSCRRRERKAALAAEPRPLRGDTITKSCPSHEMDRRPHLHAIERRRQSRRRSTRGPLPANSGTDGTSGPGRDRSRSRGSEMPITRPRPLAALRSARRCSRGRAGFRRYAPPAAEPPEGERSASGTA
jgi:GrpB-like predicted nucleotidyltransferase (UPF0157 family)